MRRQRAEQGQDELEAAQQVTLGFNRARVREAAGQLTAAAAEYKVTRMSSSPSSCKVHDGGGPEPQTQNCKLCRRRLMAACSIADSTI